MSDNGASTPGEQKNSSQLTIKTHARICLVQALYQLHITGDSWEKVIRDFAIKEQDRAKQWAYFTTFATDIKTIDMKTIDHMIESNLTDTWKFDRIHGLLLSILRAGIFELIQYPETPKAVLISEYLNISHAFFDGDEPKFVNGLLQHVATHLRG